MPRVQEQEGTRDFEVHPEQDVFQLFSQLAGPMAFLRLFDKLQYKNKFIFNAQISVERERERDETRL